MYRLERIQQIGERFCTCGDYLQGVARIRCTNPECGHDYSRPFSCKGFDLCPSCSRKRTILFAEHLTSEVLLRLPHRQFVFTLPRALRPFADVSRLIYDVLREFYREAAGRPLLTGMVIVHQTFGDMLWCNPHFHAIVLEDGFDEKSTFFHIPFSELLAMVEVFRRRVITLLVARELLNQDFARNLLSWKHSGFSIYSSVRILDESAQKSLAEVTERIPPKRLQLIHRYGLYAPRHNGTLGRHVVGLQRAPGGWNTTHQNGAATEASLGTASCEGVRGRSARLSEMRRRDEGDRNH